MNLRKQQLTVSLCIIIITLFVSMPVRATTDSQTEDLAFPTNDNQSYIQKSVTSLDTTLISKGVSLKHFYKQTDTLNQSFHSALALDRFNYMPLPPQLLSLFKTKLNTISDPSPEQIKAVIDTHVLPTLKSIINSTENLKIRQSQLNENQQKVTFAETKGKSNALTQDQLTIILNTAYIFIPYLSYSNTVTVAPDKNDVKKSITTLAGGVIWHHIDYDNSKITQVKLTHEVEGTHTYKIDMDKHYKDKNYLKKLTKKAIYKSEQKALKSLLSALALKTRQMNAFKLTDQIVEANHNRYSIRIGKRENIKLDDTFYMYEWALSEDNKYKPQQVGFGYISAIADNRQNSISNSILTQQRGDLQSIGGWVEEEARLKLSLKLAPFYQSGISIRKDELIINTEEHDIYLLDSNYNAAYGLILGIAFNVAHFTNVSQLFIDVTTKGGFLVSSTPESKNPVIENTNGIPLLYSCYLAINKKFWYRSHALTLSAGLGIDGIYLLQSYPGLYDVYIYTWGSDLQLGYEKLISAHMSLFATINQKWTLKSPFIEYEYNNDSYSKIKSLDHFNLGGLAINIGVEFHF